ncbi:transposase [Aquabacterium sp.]|uniref:transposase n=1 Tax=Aquabacterium sp. TaxID=1872578 RepID=UPI003D090582
MDTFPIELPAGRRRRRHSPEFRAAVIEACRRPGVSIAAVALANGLNANMLRKWVNDAERTHRHEPAGSREPMRCVPAEPSTGFVPLQLPAPSVPSEIRIEVKRAGTSISVSWPSGAAAECALWLRELLR